MRRRLRAVGYVTTELVLGVAWTGLALGALAGLVLVLVWVGLVVLAVVIAGMYALASAERGLAGWWSGRPPAPDLDTSGLRRGERARERLLSPSTTRVLAYATLRAASTLVLLPVAVVLVAVVATGLVIPFADGWLSSNGWQSSAGWASWWAPVASLLVVLAGLAAAPAVATGFAAYTSRWLAPIPSAALVRRLAEAEGRVRLAEELHDGVGHTLTVLLLQAGVARRAVHTDPATAEQALRQLEDGTRAALDRLDTLLAAVRGADAEPGALELDVVVAATRAAGQPVDTALWQGWRALPLDRRDLVVAVVREGLTNALRHAHGSPTSVTVQPQPDGIMVEVTSGPGLQTVRRRGAGHGLRGLRHRLDVVDGTLESGTDGDTFTLRALVPLP